MQMLRSATQSSNHLVRLFSAQSKTSKKVPVAPAAPLRRIFSGIQPTGIPHLGNYLGAISNWVQMQRDNESKPPAEANELIFSVVDLHALTVPQDPAALRKSIRDTAVSLLAAGLDPKKCTLFVQSQVSGHAELCWLLSCITTIGRLSHMTQFKEKSRKLAAVQTGDAADESSSHSPELGLFAYPVLMAADILLYRAAQVPVGEDQKQHLELARDIASNFNERFKTRLFPPPQPLLGHVHRVMSLRDGKAKMSKSDPSDASRINLSDSMDQVAAKIRRAKTDALIGITFEPETRPEVANLLRIYAAVSGRTVESVASEHASSNSAQFKEALTAALWQHLQPIHGEISRLRADEAFVQSVLDDGAKRAREMAFETLKHTRRAVGLD
jgi:tryptophanyl-tRNA synthetase